MGITSPQPAEHRKGPYVTQGLEGKDGAGRNQAGTPAGPNHLRPGLRTAYAEGRRTSQGLEHCPSRLLASLFQALLIRGSPVFGVSCS